MFTLSAERPWMHVTGLSCWLSSAEFIRIKMGRAVHIYLEVSSLSRRDTGRVHGVHASPCWHSNPAGKSSINRCSGNERKGTLLPHCRYELCMLNKDPEVSIACLRYILQPVNFEDDQMVQLVTDQRIRFIEISCQWVLRHSYVQTSGKVSGTETCFFIGFKTLLLNSVGQQCNLAPLDWSLNNLSGPIKGLC